jgi:hypothetical protein
MYRVLVHKDRPIFSVFIDLLYGAGRNVDTDGDSIPADSRVWTWLYIADRESDSPSIEINASQSDPTIFEVKSESQELETLAALYLFLYCGTSIAVGNRELNQQEIEDLKGRYTTQLQRAANAVWHLSSDQRPYPNID